MHVHVYVLPQGIQISVHQLRYAMLGLGRAQRPRRAFHIADIRLVAQVCAAGEPQL